MWLAHLHPIINLVFIYSFSGKRNVFAMSSGLIMCGVIQAPCAVERLMECLAVQTREGLFGRLSVGVMK